MRCTVWAVSYRTKEDTTGSLAYICYNKSNAEKAVEELNNNKPERIPFNGIKINWNEVTEFFVNEQLEF